MNHCCKGHMGHLGKYWQTDFFGRGTLGGQWDCWFLTELPENEFWLFFNHVLLQTTKRGQDVNKELPSIIFLMAASYIQISTETEQHFSGWATAVNPAQISSPQVFTSVENHPQSAINPRCFMLLLGERNSRSLVFLSPSVYPGNTSPLDKVRIGVGDDIYLHRSEISLRLCAF